MVGKQEGKLEALIRKVEPTERMMVREIEKQREWHGVLAGCTVGDCVVKVDVVISGVAADMNW